MEEINQVFEVLDGNKRVQKGRSVGQKIRIKEGWEQGPRDWKDENEGWIPTPFSSPRVT
jgi:hypothetical protein